MNDNSDKKDAVKIGITLSTQIITASLSMIAIIGAFITFVLNKKEVGSYYFACIGISFFFFVLSIFFGGKGIDKARKKGYEGIWDIEQTKNIFNYQAIAALLGIIFFLVSVLLSVKQSINIAQNTVIRDGSTFLQKTNQINHQIGILQKRINNLERIIYNNKTQKINKK